MQNPVFLSAGLIVTLALGGCASTEMPHGSPPQKPLAFASTLRCGDVTATFGIVDNAPHLRIGADSFTLQPVVAASGAKYEAVGDPTTTFWTKGQTAQLVLRGKPYPECVMQKSSSVMQVLHASVRRGATA